MHKADHLVFREGQWVLTAIFSTLCLQTGQKYGMNVKIQQI